MLRALAMLTLTLTVLYACVPGGGGYDYYDPYAPPPGYYNQPVYSNPNTYDRNQAYERRKEEVYRNCRSGISGCLQNCANQPTRQQQESCKVGCDNALNICIQKGMNKPGYY